MGEACLSVSTQTEKMPPPRTLDVAWYAVQTSYRCEQRIAQALTIKGFQTYLPVLRETHQWKDRRKVIDVPAFSGYLFVNYEPNLRNRVKILETSGIVRLLGGNHTPIPVSDTEIEAVRRTVSSGVDCARCESLVPGVWVEVIQGPLAGVQGRLARIKSGLRLIVTISAFSQAISAELGLNDVKPLVDRGAISQRTHGN